MQNMCAFYTLLAPFVFPSLLVESAAEIGGAQNGQSFPLKNQTARAKKKCRRILDCVACPLKVRVPTNNLLAFN